MSRAEAKLTGKCATFLTACFIVAFMRRGELAAKFVRGSSPIDWCEDNYVWSPHIAEFWNTLSSFAIAIPAILGVACFTGSRVERYEPKLLWLWVATTVVCVGSVLFHGTLRFFFLVRFY